MNAYFINYNSKKNMFYFTSSRGELFSFNSMKDSANGELGGVI